MPLATRVVAVLACPSQRTASAASPGSSEIPGVLSFGHAEPTTPNPQVQPHRTQPASRRILVQFLFRNPDLVEYLLKRVSSFSTERGEKPFPHSRTSKQVLRLKFSGDFAPRGNRHNDGGYVALLISEVLQGRFAHRSLAGVSVEKGHCAYAERRLRFGKHRLTVGITALRRNTGRVGTGSLWGRVHFRIIRPYFLSILLRPLLVNT